VNNKALKWLWDLTSVSLAAQLGTLPLALFYFNQFPNYFLLTNYIAIPLSTVVIYAAVTYLVLFFIPVVGGVVGWSLAKLLWLLNKAIAAIHALPGSVSLVYAGTTELLLMAILLCCWVGYAELRRYYFIPIALTALLLLPVGRIAEEVAVNSRTELIVYADRKAMHLQLNAGRREWVLTSDSTSFVKLAGKYRLRNRLVNQAFVVDTTSCFTVMDGRRIAVINDEYFRRRTALTPLQLDYLLVNTLKGYKPGELISCFKPRICIAGVALSEYYSGRLQQECSASGVEFYSLRKSGAYREQLIRNALNTSAADKHTVVDLKQDIR